MAQSDLYERDWTPEARQRFLARLERCRGTQGHHVAAQARMLAAAGTTESLLAAIELYCLALAKWPDEFNIACNHWAKAECFEKLERFDEARESYEAAIEAQRRFPGVRTQADLDYGMLVVRQRWTAHYDKVLAVLHEFREGENGLAFHACTYAENAIRAMIAAEKRETRAASEYATRALAAAGQTHSGLRYHPSVGLVEKPEADLLDRLQQLAQLRDGAGPSAVEKYHAARKTPATVWDEMNDAIEAAGGPQTDWLGDRLRPMEQFDQRANTCAPWIDIILQYAPRLSRKNERWWVVRCMAVKGLKKAVPFLLSLYDEEPRPYNLFTEAAHALAKIDDKASYPKILAICADPAYGIARLDLIPMLGRMRRDPRALPTILRFFDRAFAEAGCDASTASLLYGEDPFTVARTLAMGALTVLGGPQALGFLEGLDVRGSLRPIKDNALARLRRKAERTLHKR